MKNIVDIKKNSSPTCLLYVIERFPSPTEYFILNEIIELEKRGFKLFILVLKKQKNYLNFFSENQVKSTIVYLPKFYFFFPLLTFFYSLNLNFPSDFSLIKNLILLNMRSVRNYGISLYFYRKLKNERINHIHAHFAFITADIASILVTLFNVKYSVTMHAQDIYCNIPRVKSLMNEVAFVLTCTQYNCRYINKITHNLFKDKIHAIYHGIDASKWKVNNKIRVTNNSMLRIISVARLVEKKGMIYLLKAVNILLSMGEQVKCTIIGEGHQKKYLESYISRNKLNHSIEILDFMQQEKIMNYLNNSDIFVLPCIIAETGDRDGLPNVILEAICMEVPVISTPVSAIPEIIDHNVTGLLVKERDEMELVKSILELKNNKDLREEIIQNSKNRLLKEYTIECCTEKLCGYFVNITK